MTADKTLKIQFPIPGTQAIAEMIVDEDGKLLQMICKGHIYIERDGNALVFDAGWVSMSELLTRNSLLRQVSAGDDFWVEKYRWNDSGRVIEVDGVCIERDERQRVIACHVPDDPKCSFSYAYQDDFLINVERGDEQRQIVRGKDGRVRRIHQDSETFKIAYADDSRADVSGLPAHYHRDEYGRLWTITDPDNPETVLATFLWDGYRCLGRIDGASDADLPLAAVFSLDPTGTPVRLITRDGMWRIPRDAYGENLLNCEGIPGLYGGAVYDGFVYYSYRTLDPLSGTFASPDPLDGFEDDPRRAEGYRGPLIIEHPAAGPYAVCQHDPISRSDPTGAMSWWIPFSDLTWSLTNNLVTLLAMDLTFNLWGSIITGGFFDRAGLSSSRVGTWGMRVGGVIAKLMKGRVFTYQHYVWSDGKEFDILKEARVFYPNAAFRPTLYGTMLQAVPKEGTRFLLSGSPDMAPKPARPSEGKLPTGPILSWTRSGGTAEPIIPGSMTPHFPSGGLHFDDRIDDLHTPLDCTMNEIEAMDALLSGTVTDRLMIDLPAINVGLNPDALVFMTDKARKVFIEAVTAAVQHEGKTRVYFRKDFPSLANDGVRFRGLSAPLAAENVNHGAAMPASYLDATGTTQAYAVGDPVRLNQGGNPVGADIIDRLEVKLNIDAPVTNIARPLSVMIANPLGATPAAKLTADVRTLTSPANRPDKDIAVIIRNAGGASRACIVTDHVGANEWKVDRDVTPALGAANGDVTWQRLMPNMAAIGTKTGDLETDSTLVYNSNTVRTAPAAGTFLVLRNDAGKLDISIVTSIAYDAIVLVSPLPGNSANPYSVERFNYQAPDHKDLKVIRGQDMILSPAVPNDAVALYLLQYAGSTMATGVTVTAGAGLASANFTVAGRNASLNIGAGASANNLEIIRPSHIVGLRPAAGGAEIPALVKKVRVSITLDRNLPLAATDMKSVLLTSVGIEYDAKTQPIPAGSGVQAILDVKPTTANPTAGTQVQMPHFQAGGIVRVDYGGSTQFFRIGAPAGDAVAAVDGLTLGLMDGSPPAPLPANATIRQMEPSSIGRAAILPPPLPPPAPAPAPLPNVSATGSAYMGIRGTATPAPGGTRQVSFDVWAGDDLRVGRVVAIVSGGVSYPARIATVDKIEFDFVPLSAAANGLYDIVESRATIRAAVASFTRDIGAIDIADRVLTSDPNRLVLAIPFKNSAITAAGKLHGGSVIVPDDVDDGELSRHDALETHELQHTKQSAAFGPLMLFGFPTWLLEAFLEGFTDVELPPVSAYVPATLSVENGSRFIEIPTDPAGFTLETDNEVQISWQAAQPGGNVSGAGNPITIKLGTKKADHKFLFAANISDVPLEVINVQVRRLNAIDGWRGVMHVARQLSPGGIMNQVVGFIYGGLFRLIERGFNGLSNIGSDQHKNYPATVEGAGDDAGKLLRLSDVDGRAAILNSTRVIIQKDDFTLVRSVANIADGVLRLTDAITLSGSVRVAPYSTTLPDSFWDWRSYYPATSPDPARPAAIRVDGLTLEAFDWVLVLDGKDSSKRLVTAVSPDGLAELEGGTGAKQPQFLVAKIGEEDPIGGFDGYVLNKVFDMDWMRWAFDPYSQLHYRLKPTPGSAADWIARIARYMFSSSSWSFFYFCVVLVDGGGSYNSRIEQSASGVSGDNYTPVGRLRGKVEYVGDIAFYWNIPSGGGREFESFIVNGMQDMAGIWLTERPRIMTSLVNAPAGTDGGDLNEDVILDPAVTKPGYDVPDVFYAKDSGDPTINPAGISNPTNSFLPALRGWVPTSPTLQRSSGIYVAFSRPGRHRTTIATDVDEFLDKKGVLHEPEREARDAQKNGRQDLYFDRTLKAVEVKVNGQVIADGAVVNLVHTQRITIQVTPNGARRYAANLLRPAKGEVLRAPDANNPLVIEAQRRNGDEPIEISRWYRYDTATKAYNDGILNKHGIHIPTDIHIPIHTFKIEVKDTLPVRNALSLAPAAIITELAKGATAFVFVPTSIGPTGLRITSATPVGGGAGLPLPPLAALIQPMPAVPAPPLAKEIRDFIGLGVVYRLVYAPAIVVPSPTDLVLTVDVGSAAPYAPLTVAIRLLV